MEAALWCGDRSTHLQTTTEQLARNLRLKLNPVSTLHPLQCPALHMNIVVICDFFLVLLISCLRLWFISSCVLSRSIPPIAVSHQSSSTNLLLPVCLHLHLVLWLVWFVHKSDFTQPREGLSAAGFVFLNRNTWEDLYAIHYKNTAIPL